ncbi:hypothetical protein [Verrucomicrobium sp. BvORR106]|uniref:hypothetical protein n=1 Tax=Verrucomicrobium sp. BvORR106 TaxID=1403819 RepID=UPI00056F991A|nr:hypothetical protein [Verrucomicrobium sp. BvORR106]
MTNSIFQGKQYRALEDRAITAAHALHLKVPDLLRIGLTRLLFEIEETGTLALSLDGSPPAPSVKKAKPDILTPKTRRRIEAVDSAMGGGWLEGVLQDLLETVIAEGWAAELPKRFMPPTVFYSQFMRLKCLQETWVEEDKPKPAPQPDASEKGLTDDRPKRGRKKRPHPLFGDTPRKAA